MSNRIELLLKAPFLVSLAILIANDHLFKALYPSFLTGKLSDFAGLFVLPIFLFVILSPLIRSRRAILLLHFGIGLAFIFWKLAPLQEPLTVIEKAIQIPLPGRVKDATDLMALSILPVSYKFIISQKYISSMIISPAFRRLALLFVMLLSTAAIMATSMVFRNEIHPNLEMSHGRSKAQAVYIFEQTLLENDFTVESRNLCGDTLMYMVRKSSVFEFHWPKSDTCGKLYHSKELIEYEIEILNFTDSDSLMLARVTARNRYGRHPKAIIEDIIRESLIEPFERKLARKNEN